MLELAILLSVLALCLAALSVVGFAAVLAAGVAVMLAAIFVDWLRHRSTPIRRLFHARFAPHLRPLFEARMEVLLLVSLAGFLGWLAYLWYTLPAA